MESLAPALVDGMESVLDTLREGTAVVVCDPERVRTRAHDLVATSQEFLEAGWANAASGNAVPIDLEGMFGTASFWGLADLRAHARDGGMPWWDLGPFVADEELADDDSAVVNSGLEEAPRYRGSTPEAVSDLRGWVADGWRVVVVTEGHGLARRVAEVLADESVPARLDADLTDLAPGMVHLTSGSVGAGFVSAASRFALITETDLTGTPGQGGSTKDMRKMPSKRRNQVDPLQLRPGDFVVHEQHGVGRFVEMVQRKIGDATREYLVLEYAPGRRGQPGDRLFVPTDQLDQVTRYVGGEQPTLNKMGGSDWQKTKGRARKYVKQIAAELIQLYSARMATSGFAFGADTPWQRELEDAFVYVETPDQLSSIDEVKADMERTVPMDRLICGDVGYGKTEIAVRAAFKAIQDGKQVAVLVPTTRKHLDRDTSLEIGQVARERHAGRGYLSNVQPWRDAWVWESVAEEIGDHRRRGYGAIVTEDVLRFAAARAIGEAGSGSASLRLERPHPSLPGSRVDLAIGEPPEALIEFNYPCEPNETNAELTKVFAEILKDFYRLAAHPGEVDRIYVLALTRRLRSSLPSWAGQYGVDLDSDEVSIRSEAAAALPSSAAGVVGDELRGHPVSAVRLWALDVDEDLRINVFKVDPVVGPSNSHVASAVIQQKAIAPFLRSVGVPRATKASLPCPRETSSRQAAATTSPSGTYSRSV